MTRPIAGGRRRVDRVLDPSFVADVDQLPMDELRRRRREAEQEETDLSYLRRMMHGRIDILSAEIARRAGDGAAPSVLDSLVGILTDADRGLHGSGRHLPLEPTRVGEHRRLVERAIADTETSDVGARTDAELEAAAQRLAALEREVSEVRHEVQRVADLLSGEIARRYRDGLASVDTLLGTDPSA